MPSRRQVLASTGLLATGAPIVSADTDDEIPAEEVGLADEISDLLASGQIERARELTEEHDIRHSIAQQSVRSQPGNSDGGVSIQRVYEDTATVYCSLLKLDEDDRWTATGAVYHNGDIDPSIRDYATAPDASILYWNDNKWASPDATSDNVRLGITSTVNGNLSRPHDINFDKYRPGGTSAKVNLYGPRPRSFTLSHQTELKKDYSGTDFGVQYVYIHTRALTSIGSVSIGIEPGDVEIKNAEETWKQDAVAHP